MRAFSALALCALALPALLPACSTTPTGSPSNTSGSVTFHGTVGGKTVAFVDAVALKGVYDSAYPGIVTIFFTNQPNFCATAKTMIASGASKANLIDFGFALGATNATSVVTVGTYTPSGSPTELDTFGWDSYDATCKHTTDTGWASNTVTLTSVGLVYAGTFDGTSNTGEHVSGSFNAPLCDLSGVDRDAGGSADGGVACLP